MNWQKRGIRSKMPVAAGPKKFTEESSFLHAETGLTVPRRTPKTVSGAGLSFRFMVGKAEDDRAVAYGESVTPCHKQGHASSSSVLFRKSSFSFPLLFPADFLFIHLRLLTTLLGKVKSTVFVWVLQLVSQVSVCHFMRYL